MNAIAEFINPDEQKSLVDWAYEVRNLLEPNPASPKRFFKRLKELPENTLVDKVIQKILKVYKLDTTLKYDGDLGSLLSWHDEGGSVHEHTDKPLEYPALRHYRFNLFINLPDAGGVPIYNGKPLDVEERRLVPYEADIHPHSSTKVIGIKPRIVLSFGWLFSEVCCDEEQKMADPI